MSFLLGRDCRQRIRENLSLLPRSSQRRIEATFRARKEKGASAPVSKVEQREDPSLHNLPRGIYFHLGYSLSADVPSDVWDFIGVSV